MYLLHVLLLIMTRLKSQLIWLESHGKPSGIKKSLVSYQTVITQSISQLWFVFSWDEKYRNIVLSFVVAWYYQSWNFRDLILYKSWSRSWSWNLRVLVFNWSWSWNPWVESGSWSWSWDLGPRRLGLRHLWSVKLRQNRKSSIARKSLLSACHLCSCVTDI